MKAYIVGEKDFWVFRVVPVSEDLQSFNASVACFTPSLRLAQWTNINNVDNTDLYRAWRWTALINDINRSDDEPLLDGVHRVWRNDGWPIVRDFAMRLQNNAGPCANKEDGFDELIAEMIDDVMKVEQVAFFDGAKCHWKVVLRKNRLVSNADNRDFCLMLGIVRGPRGTMGHECRIHKWNREAYEVALAAFDDEKVMPVMLDAVAESNDPYLKPMITLINELTEDVFSHKGD